MTTTGMLPSRNTWEGGGRLYWPFRIFLSLAILWNVWAAFLMATRRVEILGEAAASGRPGVYLSLVIVFLLIGAALTAFLIFDPKRYWPLLWIAALGRIAGAWVLLSAWNAGISDQALVPAMVDLAFGLGCLAFAMAFLRHGRRLSPSG